MTAKTGYCKVKINIGRLRELSRKTDGELGGGECERVSQGDRLEINFDQLKYLFSAALLSRNIK